MTFNPRLPPAQKSRLAGLAFGLAAFAATVTAYAALLIRTRAVEASAGYGAFLAGLGLATLAAALGVLAMVVVWRSGLKGGVRAFFAVVLAAAVLGGPAFVALSNAAAPPLTDVSTDLEDPPRFDRAVVDRAVGDLPAPEAIPQAAADAQRAFYPDMQPLKLSLAPDEVANLAIGLVEDRRWRLLGRTSFPRGGPPTGRIEAVARTLVLGFEEDVVIRMRVDPDGTVVDMRSASRIGRTDFGSNAARIRSFLADLASAANAAP